MSKGTSWSYGVLRDLRDPKGFLIGPSGTYVWGQIGSYGVLWGPMGSNEVH